MTNKRPRALKRGRRRKYSIFHKMSLDEILERKSEVYDESRAWAEKVANYNRKIEQRDSLFKQVEQS